MNCRYCSVSLAASVNQDDLCKYCYKSQSRVVKAWEVLDEVLSAPKTTLKELAVKYASDHSSFCKMNAGQICSCGLIMQSPRVESYAKVV